MKFDVVVGNPPYQESNGGGGNGKSAKSIYQNFIKFGLDTSKQTVSMITPNRWLTEDSDISWKLRKQMLENGNIDYIKTYSNSWDIFPTIGNIAGGVGYITYNKNSKSNTTKIINDIHGEIIEAQTKYDQNTDIFINDAVGLGILNKINIIELNNSRLSSFVSITNPFGLDSNFKGNSVLTDDIYSVHTSSGMEYLEYDKLTKNRELAESFKVLTSKYLPSGGFADKQGKFKVLSKSEVLKPYEICTQSYLVIGPFENEKQAKIIQTYLKFKITRYLIHLAISGLSLNGESFKFVPMVDLNDNISENDIYEKYNITLDEQKYINKLIKDF